MLYATTEQLWPCRRECIFLAAAGLRGSVSLILTQAVIIESPVTKNTIPQVPIAHHHRTSFSCELPERAMPALQGEAELTCSLQHRHHHSPDRVVFLHVFQLWVLLVSSNDRRALQSVQAEVVMFTVVFVLLTLLVNAPLLPLILRWTRLNVVPPQVP